MTPTRHYECALEQADGKYDLDHRAIPGGSGDLYTDVNPIFAPGSHDYFGDTTQPDSKWWDGTPSGLTIRNISQPVQTMTFEADS